jgi:hypothetical protein
MAKQGFVSIHGKEYETVASRVNRFRNEHKNSFSLVTNIVKIDADECIVEAKILDETGRVIANGHAQEFRGSSQINKTSYVENCETSAIGRALACFGIGGTEFASANEVLNAIHQQTTKVESITKNDDKAFLDSSPYEPVTPERMIFVNEQFEQIKAFFNEGMYEDCYVTYDNISDMAERTEVWKLLNKFSAIRSKITSIRNQKVKAA